jgi:glycosyltransferase involved in cell wall biosynthesis
MDKGIPVYAVLHHPPLLSAHSGMDALADAVGAKKIYYNITWNNVQRQSWTIGQWLRVAGNRFYGSEWNALVPWIDETKIRGQIQAAGPHVVHFLWAEFARPRKSGRYHRRGGRLIGTFHASARKQPEVIRHREVFEVFDFITLMSESQKPFFLAHNYSANRMRIIPHGVDSDYFTMGPDVRGEDGQPLRALLVGKTERDHEFAAKLMRKVPAGVMELTVCTTPEHAVLYYRDVSHVNVPPRLSDEELRRAYQAADLLFMPVHDCAANNAVLEAMACGTPVMANRVGGIPEYVPDDAGILMERKNVDEWIDVLRGYVYRRGELRKKGAAARRRAEELSWHRIAHSYAGVYKLLIPRDEKYDNQG